jgi:hypothetical protein
VRRIPVNQATGKSSILGYQRATNGPDMDHSGISRYEWKLACLLTGDCPGAELEDFLVLGNTMFPTISGPNRHQFEQFLEASGFLSHVLRRGCLKKKGTGQQSTPIAPRTPTLPTGRKLIILRGGSGCGRSLRDIPSSLIETSPVE